MTVEYILLLALFVFFVMGALVSTPVKSFDLGGPRLGARVEKHLMTGDGFGPTEGNGTAKIDWQ